MNKINWERVAQTLKAITIILVIVVFGILGYYQIRLIRTGKQIDEIERKLENIRQDYEQVRETYKNEIENVEVE